MKFQTKRIYSIWNSKNTEKILFGTRWDEKRRIIMWNIETEIKNEEQFQKKSDWNWNSKDNEELKCLEIWKVQNEKRWIIRNWKERKNYSVRNLKNKNEDLNWAIIWQEVKLFEMRRKTRKREIFWKLKLKNSIRFEFRKKNSEKWKKWNDLKWGWDETLKYSKITWK